MTEGLRGVEGEQQRKSEAEERGDSRGTWSSKKK